MSSNRKDHFSQYVSFQCQEPFHKPPEDLPHTLWVKTITHAYQNPSPAREDEPTMTLALNQLGLPESSAADCH